MRSRLWKTLLEVAQPVLPVAGLIAFLQLVVVRLPWDLFARFGIGVVLVIIGFSLFLLGVRLGLLPLGEYVGSHLPGRVSVWIMVLVVLVLGFVATLAEPDVRVLAESVETAGSPIGRFAFILVVSAGLGLALAIAVLRQLTGVKMAYIFGLGYGAVLLMLPFSSRTFVALAFDAGSTTTGSLSVPLILALGLGVARTLGGRGSLGQGFGLVGIASMGPVILLTIIGLFA